MDNFDKFENTEAADGISKERFRAVGLAIAIYALLFGICLYNNISGIMTVVITAATVALICYCSFKTGCGTKAASKSMYPYYVGIVLLGISTCCTADEMIISVNYMGIALLVFCALVRIFCNDKGWGIGKYTSVLFEMVFAPLQYIMRPFQDYKVYRSSGERKKNAVVKYVILGILMVIPFLVVVVVLLASADIVFGEMMGKLLDNIDLSGVGIFGDGISFIFMVVAVFVYVYGLAVKLMAGNIDEDVSDKRKLEPVVAITFTGMLTFVYLIFSGIQILYLFSNSMKLPRGYTYAEYAREGFFQLLAVACINLVIVLFCIGFFRKNKVLNVVLVVMSACTYIMIASSAMRMLMYIDEYDLTYLRIQVLLALLIMAVVMAGVIISIFRESFPLVHYTIAAVGAIWILFSFCRLEYIIAKYNISRFEVLDESDNGVRTVKADYSDMQFLASLGPDSAPAIYELAEDTASGKVVLSCWDDKDIEEIYEIYFSDVSDDWDEAPGIRGFNFSHYKAYKCSERIESLYK